MKNYDIRSKKLIYHLTSLDNLASILTKGLLPRANLTGFVDVADPEIIATRRGLQLEVCVPFHFFARNPFDGRVQTDHPDKRFALIAVRREAARMSNWKIIPRHPLAGGEIQIFDYDAGIEAIDWVAMNKRDYADPNSKCVCMAECVSPGPVAPDLFQAIYIKNDADAQRVRALLIAARLRLFVEVSPAMFLK